MNVTDSLIRLPFESATGIGDGSRDAAFHDAFSDLLDTAATRLEESFDSHTTDERRDDDDADTRDDASRRDVSEDDSHDERKAGATGDGRSVDTAMLEIPLRTAAASQAGSAGVTSPRKPSAAPTAAAPTTGGASLKSDVDTSVKPTGLRSGPALDATIVQERPGVRSRPLATIANGVVPADVEGIEALRTNARAVAERKFAAGETAIERIAARKSGEQARPQPDAETNAGTRQSSGDRTTAIADRLAPRAAGTDVPPPAKPVAASATTAALQAATPSIRSGDMSFTLPTADGQADPLHAAYQSAGRALHSGQAAAQLAARAPQASSGTPAEQVSVQIRHGVRNDADRISVRLHPATLGKVEVKLEVAPDKAVHAIVTAERPETLDMLARDARVLQRALEDAGLQTDSNSLSFRHDDGGDRSARGFDGFGGRGYAGSNDPAGAEIAETGETITRRAIHDGVLDVEI